jgi:hypothetical protein
MWCAATPPQTPGHTTTTPNVPAADAPIRVWWLTPSSTPPPTAARVKIVSIDSLAAQPSDPAVLRYDKRP